MHLWCSISPAKKVFGSSAEMPEVIVTDTHGFSVDDAVSLQGRLAIARGQFVTNQLSESVCCFNPLLRRTPLSLLLTTDGRGRFRRAL
jgi:hypothetical protein